jgi:hypothetical protein
MADELPEEVKQAALEGYRLMTLPKKPTTLEQLDAAVKKLGLAGAYYHLAPCPGCGNWTIGCDCCGGGLMLRRELGFCCFRNEDRYLARKR